MAYQALYRVWRSQKFSDLIGQQAVTQTLKNAIASHQTSHAYLFCGPRGTGKTSAAKIFAKAINCPNSKDGEPCNECEICQAITEGRLNDVMEIDAASNNGVDEIRELRDKVKYAPTQGKFKVYIIDEVHMLSTGAFNALLKTLEEPPKSVIFILATTEVHKIPATIISRCQRFDFKKISNEDIVAHLKEILEKMDKPYEETALNIIARAAEGGMRDALSILDQAISYRSDEVTQQAALEVTGSLSEETLSEYLLACVRLNVEKSLEILENILQEGKEPKRFLENLLTLLRDLLMYQKAPEFFKEQHAQVSDSFKSLGEKITPEMIYHYIKILNSTQQDLRFTNEGRIYLEVTTVKLATENTQISERKQVGENPNSHGRETVNAAVSKEILDTTLGTGSTSENILGEIKNLEKKIQVLEDKLQQVQNGKVTHNPQVPQRKATKQNLHPQIPKQKVYDVLKEATHENLQGVRHHWVDVLQLLSPAQKALMMTSEVVAASPKAILAVFTHEIISHRAQEDEELHFALKNGFNRLIQYEPELVAIPKDVWPKLRQSFVAQLKQGEVTPVSEEMKEMDLVPEVKKDELVETAHELFGDAVEIIND